MPVKIFFCYAREDKQLVEELKTHLLSLQKYGLIEMWYDQKISAGMEWEREISNHLNTANIILLLVSSYFLASSYCSKEMQRAMERHKRGEVRVIPIILRPIPWQNTPFSKLQVLPLNAKPVVHPSWRKAEAFFTVVEGIRTVVEELLTTEMPNDKIKNQQLPSDPRGIIIEILSIIGYEDDKEAYANEFIDLCEKQALLDCLQALSPDKQTAFKQQMSRARNLEDVKAIIAQYVTGEQYAEALKLASQTAFTKFMETLLPELDDEQISRLETYLAFLFAIGTVDKKEPPNTTFQEIDVFDEKAIHSFIDNLISEEEGLGIAPEDRNALQEQLTHTINTHLVSLLSDEDQEELDKLLDKDPTDEKLGEFFQQKIPNLHAEITKVLTNFKYAHTNAQKLDAS